MTVIDLLRRSDIEVVAAMDFVLRLVELLTGPARQHRRRAESAALLNTLRLLSSHPL